MAKLGVIALFAGCISACSASSSGPVNSTPEAPSPDVAGSQETSTVPLSAEEALNAQAEASGATVATGVIQHACGVYALTNKADQVQVLTWDGQSWSQADQRIPGDVEPTTDAFLDGGTPRRFESAKAKDVTDDGQPEIIVNWSFGDRPYVYGQILYTDNGDCTWRAAQLIDGCDVGQFFLDLRGVDNQDLKGVGHLACSPDVDDVAFTWNSEFGVFLTRPVGSNKYCRRLVENYDLVLSTCDEGWAVQMAQAAIAAEGIEVDVDGQFGPGTQIAVLRYQERYGLTPTGVIDGSTWGLMYPVGGVDGTNTLEYPDFDGDGVSSPREIGHASGAFDGGDF